MSLQPRTLKGQATQAKLLSTALDCFKTLGYKEASMRVIAQRAGVSISHAYYYFDSKEDIVALLLQQLRTEQYETCMPLLDEANTLETNIRLILDSTVQIFSPYHDFGSAFLKVLLATETADGSTTDLERELWQRAVSAARPLPPLGIRKDLPRFLQLLSRLLFSSWAHDHSVNQRRSLSLMKNTAPVIAKFAVLCRLPVVRSLFSDVFNLLAPAEDEATTSQHSSDTAANPHGLSGVA